MWPSPNSCPSCSRRASARSSSDWSRPAATATRRCTKCWSAWGKRCGARSATARRRTPRPIWNVCGDAESVAPTKNPAAAGFFVLHRELLRRAQQSRLLDEIQRAVLSGKVGGEIAHIRLAQRLHLCGHDRVLARTALVLAERLQQIVFVLAGELGKLGRDGTVAVRAVAGGANLLGDFRPCCGVARQDGRGEQGSQREDE